MVTAVYLLRNTHAQTHARTHASKHERTHSHTHFLVEVLQFFEYQHILKYVCLCLCLCLQESSSSDPEESPASPEHIAQPVSPFSVVSRKLLGNRISPARWQSKSVRRAYNSPITMTEMEINSDIQNTNCTRETPV